MKQVLVLLTVIVLGCIWVSSIKAKVAYAETDCPTCGSSEVLDFGYNEEGDQHCHCYDCGQEFYILNNHGDE